VGNQDRGKSIACMQAFDQAEQGIRSLVIQISCGLIRQQKFRLGNQSARDRDTLLLPAGKLSRTMGRPVPQSHLAQPMCGLPRARRGSATFSTAVNSGSK
jgi:hypothetical protein